MIKLLRENLLHATERTIAHQVNCYGAAGGLAGAIFHKWPEAEKEYQSLIAQTQSRQNLLGTCQLVRTKDGNLLANLFGQYQPGADTRYDALEQALLDLASQLEGSSEHDIAIPYKIGCGIGGGDWDTVQEIIRRTIGHLEVTIYKL